MTTNGDRRPDLSGLDWSKAEIGRSSRTLALDCMLADGRIHRMAAGPLLLRFARLNNGEPHPNPGGVKRDAGEKRVAEV